jgi:hypothetical protein
MKLVARACFEWVLVSISKPFSGFGSDIMLYTHKACVCVHHFFDPNLEWLHYHGSLWQALDGVRLMTVLYRFLWVSLKVGHPYKALVYEHFFLLELPFLGIHHCWPNPTCGINSYKLYIYIYVYIYTEYNYKPFHKLCTIHYNHGPCKSTDHVLKIFDWDDRDPGHFVGYVFPYSRFFLMYHVGNYINIFYTIWFYMVLSFSWFWIFSINRIQ